MSGPMGAQSRARTVHGVIVDQWAHPLEHSVVQIQNDWTLMIRSYITQGNGKYRFAGLNPDIDYEITAEYDGIRSSRRILSKFDSRKDAEIDLTIHVGK